MSVADQRITIERLAFGGSGVGRMDGKVCFVPYGCPGDELRVRVTAEKRSYLTAAIVEIIVPGRDRVAPPCPLFGSCGGCSWQHVAYPRQVAEKGRIFADTMWRGARVPGERIADVVPSSSPYGYRGRVQFKLHAAGGGVHIGFYRQGSHYVEDAAQGCPVALPAINRVLERLRSVLAQAPEPNRIPQINVECAQGGMVAIVNYIGHDREGCASFFLSRREELEPLSGLYLQSGRKWTLARVYGDDWLEYTLPGPTPQLSGCTLGYLPGGFAQVNAAQNAELLRLVRQFARCGSGDRILDLYCGNGNFSLPLAGEVASVTGVEDYGDSIAAARLNATRNGIHNAEFICADAAAGVSSLLEAGRSFTTVILDPPRTGAADTLRSIIGLRPERIVYISCDPATLARDCGVLAGGGYGVVSSVPVDMFPQTYHLESVTLLERVPEGAP